MNTAFDGLDAYEERLRRSSARAKVLKWATVFVLVGAFLGFKVFKLVGTLGHSRPTAAAVVRVSDDGALSVDGCSTPVAACLTAAVQRIHTAGGAHSVECLIVPSAGATAAGESEAMRACLAAGLSPATMPRGAKW